MHNFNHYQQSEPSSSPLTNTSSSYSSDEEDIILEKIMSELSSPTSALTDGEVAPSSLYVYPPHANHDTTKVRKKRKLHINDISRNKKLIRIPRVLNSDIRKKYPVMVLNMLNSCHYDYMSQFFHTYTDILNTSMTWNHNKCRDCFSHPEEASRYSQSSGMLRAVRFQQIKHICKYLFFSSLTIPDRAYEMIHSEVITRSDSFETSIVIYYKMTGMKSYHCNPIHAGVVIQSYATSPTNSSTSSSSIIDEDLREDSVSSEEEFSLLKLFYQKIERMETPRLMTSHGKITLTVENYRESMKINQIIVESSSNFIET